MKLETINKYTSLLDDMLSGEYDSVKDFCEKNELDYNTFIIQIGNLRKVTGEYKALCEEALQKYELFKHKDIPSKEDPIEDKEETIDNDEKSEIKQIRDKDGKIIAYSFKIFKKNKAPIIGRFDRNEMNQLYGLYSYYGSNLQQRIVSRYFPDYSLVDVKRILRAFNITKASSPFAPHMYEEHTEDELKEILARLKENNFLKRVEKDQISDLQKLNVKIAKENLELKQQLATITDLGDITVDLSNAPVVDYTITNNIKSDKILMLHLADMHIGAKLESGCLYNNDWNKEELYRRLKAALTKITSFGTYYKIYLNMMGDNLDGMDQQTARRDHMMPQNMDNKEQFNSFIEVMTWFVGNLRKCTNELIINSVPEGNHDGDFGYVASFALKAVLEKQYNIEFNLSSKFLSHFDVNGETFILCHGKDSHFMKKPMPKELNDRTDIWLRDYIDSESIINYGHIHVIKADLHSNALSANKKYTYRNVLSLFGESDYSQMNYPRNGYGVSYELIVDNNVLSGTFENF